MVAAHLLPDDRHNKPAEIDAGFLFADGITLGKIGARSASMLPLREAERHRLVEAAKSPTRSRLDILAKIHWDLREKPAEGRVLVVDADALAADRQEKTDKSRERDQNNVGSKTIIQFREWADEWRIRTQVDTTVGTKPPDRTGARESVFLSSGGARKIADSCAYMAAKNGGYKTFVTGTFSPAARARIDSGETTIQREVTRTMDALSKKYHRGWLRADGSEVPGASKSLAYCWVVEVPENDQGEKNPHVHMLLDWQVQFSDFKEWAGGIEAIWGNGYFHIEKINDPLCAGAYMAKAAGYISKAAGAADQGCVRGNRYAISKRARAPEWYTVGTFELSIMGHLIREVFDSITARHGAIFAERKRLNAEREAVRERAKKQMLEQSEKKRYPLWAKQARDRIGEQLMAVRKKINELPVRASKYQLVLRGTGAYVRFLQWANRQGWHGEQRPDSHWYAEFKRRLYHKKRLRAMSRSETEVADYAELKVQSKTESFREAISGWCSYAMSFANYGGVEIAY